MFCAARRVLAAITAVLVPAGAWAGGEDGAAAEAILGPPVALDRLDQQRAGEASSQMSRMRVNASLNDNEAINTLNGSNFITGEAFAGASGLPVAVQNSGNNVIIQNAFILNLNVK